MTAATGGDEPPDAYEDLLAHYRRISSLGDASGLLRWDQQVMMPDAGTPARSRQLSTLSGIKHELLTDDDVGDWLYALEDVSLDPTRRAAVREISREHDRATSVPRHLVERIATASSDAHPAWERARGDDDFAAFAPHLDDIVDLQREYAAHIDPDRPPYAVLFEEYEPYIPLDTAERVLTRLRDELVPLIDGAVDPDGPTPFGEARFPAAAQEALARDVLDAFGFDWDRARLDTSTHPFTSGTQHDCRITTRFDESDPLGGLMAAIHEFGHAAYMHGLPRDAYATPLGEARDLTVHESQSRLWENHVGRSRAFWEFLEPLVRDHLGVDASPAELHAAATRVYPDNCIRVEADELTYHLHIVLRFEIERDLIAGDLGVADVPGVWNDGMDRLLGVRPDTDREGCLQDIHWANGSFGYFPTYTLGSVLAAQLYAAAADDLGGLDGRLRAGEFGPLREWLGDQVHRHGCRYTTTELIEAATGEPLTADYFLEYVREKYAG